MALDYGGMTPTFIYDPSKDPKIVAGEQLKDSLAIFAQWALQESEGRRSDERAADTKEFQVRSAELTEIKNLGISVEYDDFFEDEVYYNKIQDKKKARLHIGLKASNWEPDAEFPTIISDVLLTYRNIFSTDVSPYVIAGDDLNNIGNVLIKGDPELGEPAIKQLSSEEIDGIPGMKMAIEELGLILPNEMWEDAQPHMDERWEWFVASFKEGTPKLHGKNEHYFSNEVEIQAFINEKLTFQKNKLGYVNALPQVQQYMAADEAWAKKTEALYNITVDDEKQYIWDKIEGETILVTEFRERYPELWDLRSQTISGLYKMKTSDPDSYNNFMITIQEQDSEIWAAVAQGVQTYQTGYELFESHLEGQNALDAMAVTERARKNASDLEDVQDIIFPLAQKFTYLDAIATGDLTDLERIQPQYLNQDNTINKGLVNQSQNEILKMMMDYSGYIVEMQRRGETSIGVNMFDDIWNKATTRHRELILQRPGETIDKERDIYLDALEALEYNNLFIRKAE